MPGEADFTIMRVVKVPFISAHHAPMIEYIKDKRKKHLLNSEAYFSPRFAREREAHSRQTPPPAGHRSPPFLEVRW